MQQRTTIRLFQTGEHRCGYFVERMARDLLLDPHDAHIADAYPAALASGFRRSGGHVYRPHCHGCRACVAVRLVAAAFSPSRSQRRCLADNRHVQAQVAPAQRSDEHFSLYRRYLAARHAGAGMDDPTPEDFDQFLCGRWSQTRFLELRESGRLLAVAVTDQLPDALSAVYTFFEPELAARSLGTLAVLHQVRWAQRAHLRHVYLGYWIAGHPKMDYKVRFAPLECLDNGRWVPRA
ncbi:MAG: arginyltransferase [Lysobacterales bacterium CG17_big_fil_post_rev_8_21_14_2_50_64_11]|nr:MAG: arginyltransferase [Xanthomonadales bacterium CG17_big_fil_post_rev_8_21_14_2_50_64_11]PIX61000.1 MAG: arginyltransferase [Xanthomonadales bacterium CG_4_10_14_3_um_filter_64_11]